MILYVIRNLMIHRSEVDTLKIINNVILFGFNVAAIENIKYTKKTRYTTFFQLILHVIREKKILLEVDMMNISNRNRFQGNYY